jgi:hypothetical protein
LPLKKSQILAVEKPDLKPFSDFGKKISVQKPTHPTTFFLVPKRFEFFLGFLCFAIFTSWDLGDEANPKSMEGCSEFGVLGLRGRKVAKLLRKNMRKPHFRGREGRKVTNRPQAAGVPVSFARRWRCGRAV